MASTRLTDELAVLMQHPMAFYEEVIHRSGELLVYALLLKLRPLNIDRS